MKKFFISTIIIFLLILTSTLNINAAPAEEESQNFKIKAEPKPCYGYIIPIKLEDSKEIQVSINRLLNELLQDNTTIYWLTSDITVKSGILFQNIMSTNNFNKGSLIIPINSNQSLNFKTIATLFKYREYEHLEIYETTKSKIADLGITLL